MIYDCHEGNKIKDSEVIVKKDIYLYIYTEGDFALLSLLSWYPMNKLQVSSTGYSNSSVR